MNQPVSNTISYRDLPPADPNDTLGVEWNFYRREVGRLLAEGHEGRHVLIKGEEIIGIFNTHLDASTEGSIRYFGQPHLIHQIQSRERIIRSTFWFRGWPRNPTL